MTVADVMLTMMAERIYGRKRWTWKDFAKMFRELEGHGR